MNHLKDFYSFGKVLEINNKLAFLKAFDESIVLFRSCLVSNFIFSTFFAFFMDTFLVYFNQFLLVNNVHLLFFVKGLICSRNIRHFCQNPSIHILNLRENDSTMQRIPFLGESQDSGLNLIIESYDSSCFVEREQLQPRY